MFRYCAWGDCHLGGWLPIQWPSGQRLWYCPMHYDWEKSLCDIEGGDTNETDDDISVD